MDFTELVDLASEKLGAQCSLPTMSFSAPKENLLKPSAPIFVEGKYTDWKWMDGWRRAGGAHRYDWCIIRLGVPGIVRGVVVEYEFLPLTIRSIFHSSLALDGLPTGGRANQRSDTVDSNAPATPLTGDTQNPFASTRARLYASAFSKIYPDAACHV